jgi:hypothetical protein
MVLCNESCDPQSRYYGWKAIDCAKEAGEEYLVGKTALYDWYLQYKIHEYERAQDDGQGLFEVDSRGTHEHTWLLHEEDLLMQFRNHILANINKINSYSDVTYWVNNTFLVDQGPLLEKPNLELPISDKTVGEWIRRDGGRTDTFKQHYYNDQHNKPLVVAYRNEEYIPKVLALQKRMFMWVHLPTEQAEKLHKAKPDMPKGEDLGNGKTEHHVDDCEVFEEEHMFPRVLQHSFNTQSVTFEMAQTLNWEKPDQGGWGCKYKHSYSACRCHLPALHWGQDESCFKSNAKSSRQLEYRGFRGLRKKGHGIGRHCSAFKEAHVLDRLWLCLVQHQAVGSK